MPVLRHIKYGKVSEYSTRTLISPDLTAPLIMLSRVCYQSGIACEFHKIDTFYTALIVKGEMTYRERGKKALTGRRGDMFLLSAGNTYCWNISAPTVSLQCRHDGFPLREYGMPGSTFGCRNHPVTIVHLGEAKTAKFELDLERIKTSEARNFYYSAAMLNLFADAAILAFGAEKEEDRTLTTSSQLAAHCSIYIENHLTEPIDLGDMARNCGISIRKLFLLFREQFGMPPLHYIAMRKVEQARKMILKSGLSNNEIADALGFSDTNYFIRFFKKHTGASPMQTRRSADHGKAKDYSG